LIFSDEYCSTNGLFVNFSLNNITIEKYFNKIKCNFELIPNNNTIISNIKAIEKMILNKFKNLQHLNLSCRIQEQLQNGFIKLYGDDNIRYGKHSKVNLMNLD